MNAYTYNLAGNECLYIEQLDRSNNYIIRIDDVILTEVERYQLENGVTFVCDGSSYEIYGLYFTLIPKFVIYRNGDILRNTHRPEPVIWAFTTTGLIITVSLMLSSIYTAIQPIPVPTINNYWLPPFGILVGLLMGFETWAWIVKYENFARSRITVALTFIYWLCAKPVGNNLDWLNKPDLSSINVMNFSLPSAFIWICLTILFFDAAKCIRNHHRVAVCI